MPAALSIRGYNCKVVGVDLAGSPKRHTGICTLKKDHITSCTIVHTDQEIIHYVEKERPVLIAIDAPSTFRPDANQSKIKTENIFAPATWNY